MKCLQGSIYRIPVQASQKVSKRRYLLTFTAQIVCRNKKGDVYKRQEQGIKTALREVLYPNTVRDLYNYRKGYCLRLPLPIHKCKNCGRYFVVTGNITQDLSLIHISAAFQYA